MPRPAHSTLRAGAWTLFRLIAALSVGAGPEVAVGGRKSIAAVTPAPVSPGSEPAMSMECPD